MLPKELKPKGLFNLIRLGKDNDGGYLICKHSLEEASCLISFGIDDDYSFEEDFKEEHYFKEDFRGRHCFTRRLPCRAGSADFWSCGTGGKPDNHGVMFPSD